jgi:hypothetical protein
MLWLAVAVAASAVRGRWPETLASSGLMALWSGVPGGVLPGGLLVLLGWLVNAGLLPSARLGPLWWGVVAITAPFALTAALSSQVLLSVVAIAAVVAGLGREVRGRPQPR